MNKKILLLGGDGYIGFPLGVFLAKQNDNDVILVDNFTRRNLVREVQSDSLTDIKSMSERLKAYTDIYEKDNLKFESINIKNKEALFFILESYKPEVIINLAQMPSAPYSMKSAEKAVWTTENNMVGNLNLLWGMKKHCPNAHLIKMGTMGEFGTPNIAIPEGFIDIEYKGRKDTLPFPKQAGSFYHWAKCFESQHCMFTSKIWGLKITDMMQGVVYGIHTNETEKDERLITRFDYDAVFGTAINRFVIQAMLNFPLTVYGTGGQTRGFINLKDSLKCFELYINNPPKESEYRVFNQIAECDKSILQLAEMIAKVGREKGYFSDFEHIVNPRIEKEEHYYKVEKSKLKKLGFKPLDMKKEIKRMFEDLKPHLNNVKTDVIRPKIRWR